MHDEVLHHFTLPQQKDELWKIRPLTAALLDGCVKDVAYLKLLSLNLLRYVTKKVTLKLQYYKANEILLNVK